MKGKKIVYAIIFIVLILATIGLIANICDHKSDIDSYNSNGVGSVLQSDFKMQSYQILDPVIQDVQDVCHVDGLLINHIDQIKELQKIETAKKAIQTAHNSFSNMKVSDNESKSRDKILVALSNIDVHLSQYHDLLTKNQSVTDALKNLQNDIVSLEQAYSIEN